MADITYFLAPGRSLYSVDLKTKNSQALIIKDSTNNNTTIDFSKGMPYCGPFNDGCLFIAVSKDREVLYWVRTGSREAHQLLTLPGHAESDLNTLYVDELNMLFLKGRYGTGNITYRCSNNVWMRNPTPLDSIPWSSIHYNKKDEGLWVVAEKQLIHYSKDFHIIHTYTPAEGLPDIDIYSLIAIPGGTSGLIRTVPYICLFRQPE